MKFFIKDFCETVQARVVIFDMQVDNDVLYREIANHPSHAYSSLYLSNFLLFHAELQIRRSNKDNSEIIFLISQRKHTLWPLIRTVSPRQF